MIDSFIALPFSVCNEDPTHTVQLLLWKSPSSNQPLFLQVNSEIVLKITKQAKNMHESPVKWYSSLLFALGGAQLGWVYASNAYRIVTTI